MQKVHGLSNSFGRVGWSFNPHPALKWGPGGNTGEANVMRNRTSHPTSRRRLPRVSILPKRHFLNARMAPNPPLNKPILVISPCDQHFYKQLMRKILTTIKAHLNGTTFKIIRNKHRCLSVICLLSKSSIKTETKTFL